jgi:hypothetical protein
MTHEFPLRSLFFIVIGKQFDLIIILFIVEMVIC